jgi:hypothetical protein
MCGCRLLVNENVGACSFGYADISDPSHGINSYNQMKSILKERKINA